MLNALLLYRGLRRDRFWATVALTGQTRFSPWAAGPQVDLRTMSESVTRPEDDSDESPSIQQAANDLREAAGQRAREVAASAEERAQQLKEAAARKAQQFREYAGDKASTIKDAATEKASHLKDAATEKAAQFKDVAGEKAAQFKEVAGEQWQETRVKARAVHADTEDYIRQHPTKAVLIAAGAGFLLGLIVRR